MSTYEVVCDQVSGVASDGALGPDSRVVCDQVSGFASDGALEPGFGVVCEGVCDASGGNVCNDIIGFCRCYSLFRSFATNSLFDVSFTYETQ